MILQRKFTYYSLALLFIWACGGGGSKAPTEPVEPAPISNFTATPTSGLQPLEVVFTSTATGTIASYAWNVDADTDIEGTAATFTHTYTDAGTYGVTLTVTGPGGSNPKTVADMITVTSAAPTPTTATTQTTQEDGSTTISLTATDPNGQAVTFAITTDPTSGTATLSGTDITYTPNANFYGTDSFAYTASNGTYTSDPVTITITVTGEDDGNPTTNDVSATTDEDTAVTIDLDATEIDGDNYSFSIVTQPTNGTLGSINGNQVEYTPNQDFNGTDTFTFEATDDRTSRRNVATATITVNAVNDAPVANDVTASMDENKEFNRFQPVTITLDATDVEGDALTYSVVGDVTSGTLGSVSNNQIIYTPTQDFNGTDTFTYKANDGTANSNTATVTITVAAVNDAPVTTDQTAATDEDTAVEITLTSSDVESDTITYSIVSDVSNGTTSLNGTTVTYTPTANYNGTDTFTFKASDGTSDSNTSTVTITVTSVNDAPVANDVTATMNENKEFTRLMPVTITLDATDVEGEALTYSIVGTPSNGTLGSITNNQVVYTPSQDWNGEDTFTYKANDGTDDSNTATVTITVAAVNDAPVTTDQSASTDEDTAVDITLTSSDVEGDTVTYSIVSDVSNGTTALSGTTVTYTPTANFNGTDTFTFKANDGTVDSNTSTVTITVASVNDAPVANDVTASMDENKIAGRYQPVTITLDATDVEGDDLTYTVVGDVSNGTLGSVSNNQIIYTPTQDFNGTDTFTYKANDGTDDSNTATVTIAVAAVNDAPVTQNQGASTNEDTAVDITLTSTDVESDTITYSIVSDVSNGTTSLSGATVTYTPTANYNGTDTFTFKANDGTVDSNTSTVTMTVVAVNDAPVTAAVSASTNEDTAKTITLSATDVEGSSLTYSVVATNNGSVSISGSTATYNPTANWNGTDTFTYKANDGTDDSNTSTVTITVAAVNDAPIANDTNVTSISNYPYAFSLDATDVENDFIVNSIIENPKNGTILSLGSINLKYTPNEMFTGQDSLKYKVNDGSLDSETGTVYLTIENGHKTFNKDYEIHRIIPGLNNSNHLIIKDENNIFNALELDQNLDEISRTPTNFEFREAFKINDGYIVAEFADYYYNENSQSARSDENSVRKLDSNFNEIFTYNLFPHNNVVHNGEASVDYLRIMHYFVSNDDNLILGARNFESSTRYDWLLKYDSSDGNLISYVNFTDLVGEQVDMVAVSEGSDGNFYCVLWKASNDIKLAVLGSNMQLLSYSQIPSNYVEQTKFIDPDNSIIGAKRHMYKVNFLTGAILDSKDFGNGYEFNYTKHSSGDYIVIDIQSPEYPVGKINVGRVDSNFNLLWMHSYNLYPEAPYVGYYPNTIEDHDGNILISVPADGNTQYNGGVFKLDFNDGTKLLP